MSGLRGSEEAAVLPETWLWQARDLMVAARSLWRTAEAAVEVFKQSGKASMRVSDEMGMSDIAIMLGGVALENLCKGMMIHRDPSLVGPDGLATTLTHHDLPRLVADAGFVISADEAKLVSKLRQFVEWHARYPFPKRFRKPVPGDLGHLGISIPGDWERLLALYQRFHGWPLDMEYGDPLPDLPA